MIELLDRLAGDPIEAMLDMLMLARQRPAAEARAWGGVWRAWGGV